jgi:hypothetical protein
VAHMLRPARTHAERLSTSSRNPSLPSIKTPKTSKEMGREFFKAPGPIKGANTHLLFSSLFVVVPVRQMYKPRTSRYNHGNSMVFSCLPSAIVAQGHIVGVGWGPVSSWESRYLLSSGDTHLYRHHVHARSRRIRGRRRHHTASSRPDEGQSAASPPEAH